LLKAGAARIACIDVGYGQLAWELREDPRVVVLERRNARELRPGDLPFTPSLVVADLSFISLRFVLPALARVADSKAEFVLLVKPQFEAGRDEVEKGGVVRDPIVRRRTIEEVAASCRGLGISPQGVTQSPLTGPAGNVEFLVHAIAGRKERPLDPDAAVSEGR
jgi:23S rRNA (cytidine1920-2'-O)/16S rRNA (cytidine1409-2'-O)-methyltransferase